MIKTRGLYKYGKYLVINPKDVTFPDNCVWCGADSPGLREVSFGYIPPNAPFIARYILGSGLAQLAHRRSCKLNVPVCKKCEKDAHESGNWAAKVCLLLWSVGGVLIGLFFLLAYVAEKLNIELIAMVGLGALVLTIPCFIGGLIVVLIGAMTQKRATRFIPADYIGDELVWIHGHSTQFSSNLPPYEGAELRELQWNA